MGRNYNFKCPQCGYSKEISGGKAFSKRIAKVTILCENCKQLSDIILEDSPLRVEDPNWIPPKKIVMPRM
ncbi:MAG: hypothetical protein ACTSR3_23070 [Candidatus Helarchaeota archaeon]